MEWSKLKNIILIMLAAVNLCLLFFVVQREWRDSANQRQNRQQAVDFLTDRGIQIHEGQLPDDQMVPRPQTVERDQEEESRLATQLLGEDVVVQARGAGVYRYQNGAGALQFHSDGSFSAELSPDSFPLGVDQERSCLDLLTQIGFEGETTARDENTLTVRQSWEGIPLFNHQVTLVWGSEGLETRTAGRRLVGSPVERTDQRPITVASALVYFYNGLNGLGDVCNQVDSIVQGYISVTSLSGPMELIPVWRVTTDTGAYQLDLLTGELNRVE